MLCPDRLKKIIKRLLSFAKKYPFVMALITASIVILFIIIRLLLLKDKTYFKKLELFVWILFFLFLLVSLIDTSTNNTTSIRFPKHIVVFTLSLFVLIIAGATFEIAKQQSILTALQSEATIKNQRLNFLLIHTYNSSILEDLNNSLKNDDWYSFTNKFLATSYLTSSTFLIVEPTCSEEVIKTVKKMERINLLLGAKPSNILSAQEDLKIRLKEETADLNSLFQALTMNCIKGVEAAEKLEF